MTNNPRGLTPDECKALSALIETSNAKGAARKLHVQQATIFSRIQRARVKMKVNGRIQAIVQWDRFVRGGASS